MSGILQAGNVAYSSFPKKFVNRLNLCCNEMAHPSECKRVDSFGVPVKGAAGAAFQRFRLWKKRWPEWITGRATRDPDHSLAAAAKIGCKFLYAVAPKRTETSLETPGSCMVTPYKTGAMLMVFLL